jgi:hypothetical protein
MSRRDLAFLVALAALLLGLLAMALLGVESCTNGPFPVC